MVNLTGLEFWLLVGAELLLAVALIAWLVFDWVLW